MIADVARLRLAAQLISTTPYARADQVVARLGAVQAQDYLGALWAVGLRMADAREADVERAIEDRRIVRTWPMRGTLHFVAAQDARWMTELLAPRVAAGAAARLRSFELDDRVFARARRALEDALAGGKRLTRGEAYRVLERARIATANSRGLHLLWRIAHDGVIVFGPRAGKQPTFVLARDWLPRTRTRSRDEALAELATRYFTGHGPASAEDLAWWSGLPLRDVRAAIALAGNQLEQLAIAGRTYWRGDVSVPRGRGKAYLLPGFDEWLVGYADRSAVLDPAHARRVNNGGGLLAPTIVIGARVAGTWKRQLGRRGLVFQPSPFRPLAARALAAAVARYARFLGVRVCS